MTTTTPAQYAQQSTDEVSGTMTIDAGETASLPFVLAGHSVIDILCPVSMDGTALTFTVQPFPSGVNKQRSGSLEGDNVTFTVPFGELINSDGTAVTKTVSAGKVVNVPELSGKYAFTIVSNSTESPAAVFYVSATGDKPSPFEAADAGTVIPPSALSQLATFTKAAIQSAPNAWTTGNSPLTLFTVTGTVLMQVFAVITTGFTSTGTNGTVSVGVTGNTACLLPLTVADGTNFPTGAAWTDATPTLKAESLGDAFSAVLVANTNVIGTIATNNMTAGGIVLYCRWIPISAGATVTGN